MEDGVVFLANKTVLFDVTGCLTTNPTNVSKSPAKVLQAMEKGKHDHFKAKNAVLVPIAFNEFRLLETQAYDFFVLLANEAARTGPVHTLSHIYNIIRLIRVHKV